MEATDVVIVDCLGRERRPDKIYEDGSWNCPFCVAGVQTESVPHTRRKCPNPACFAREGFPPEEAQRILAASRRRAAEDADRAQMRKAREEAARAAQKEREARTAEIVAEAQKRGACATCALESARFGRTPKFPKHRKMCPRSRW